MLFAMRSIGRVPFEYVCTCGSRGHLATVSLLMYVYQQGDLPCNPNQKMGNLEAAGAAGGGGGGGRVLYQRPPIPHIIIRGD